MLCLCICTYWVVGVEAELVFVWFNFAPNASWLTTVFGERIQTLFDGCRRGCWPIDWHGLGLT